MKKMWSLLKKDLWTSFTDKTIVLMEGVKFSVSMGKILL